MRQQAILNSGRKGVSRIELQVRDSERIVEIWLTSMEKKDKQLQKLLQPVYANYKAQKYRVAVFCSGERELFDSTAGLLLHNRTG